MLIYVYQFLYISILSTFLHFAYDLTNHIFIFSIIGAINESVYEHLRLGIFPWFSWFLIRWYFFSFENTFFGNLIAVLSFMVIILFIFYGYLFIFKKHFLPVSISSFYIGILFGTFVEYLINSFFYNKVLEIIGLIGCILVFCYGMISSYYPYKYFFTIDEKYKLYGMEAHSKRCHIAKKKKYIMFIFNLLGIPLPKNEEKK